MTLGKGGSSSQAQTWLGTPACPTMTQHRGSPALSVVMHKRLKAQPRQAGLWPAASLSQGFEGAGSSPSLQGPHCHIPQTCLLSPSTWDGTEQASLTKACLAARTGPKSRGKCSSSPRAGQGLAGTALVPTGSTDSSHWLCTRAVPGLPALPESCCTEGWEAGTQNSLIPPTTL